MPGWTPFTVNSTGKVTNLNADLLDGLNNTAFLRNQVPLTLTGAVASNGVIAATNTGGANGLRGKTGSRTGSGVYGRTAAAASGWPAARTGLAGQESSAGCVVLIVQLSTSSRVSSSVRAVHRPAKANNS
jgi:hypothetical protein